MQLFIRLYFFKVDFYSLSLKFRIWDKGQENLQEKDKKHLNVEKVLDNFLLRLINYYNTKHLLHTYMVLHLISV